MINYFLVGMYEKHSRTGILCRENPAPLALLFIRRHAEVVRRRGTVGIAHKLHCDGGVRPGVGAHAARRGGIFDGHRSASPARAPLRLHGGVVVGRNPVREDGATATGVVVNCQRFEVRCVAVEALGRGAHLE